MTTYSRAPSPRVAAYARSLIRWPARHLQRRTASVTTSPDFPQSAQAGVLARAATSRSFTFSSKSSREISPRTFRASSVVHSFANPWTSAERSARSSITPIKPCLSRLYASVRHHSARDSASRARAASTASSIFLPIGAALKFRIKSSTAATKIESAVFSRERHKSFTRPSG